MSNEIKIIRCKKCLKTPLIYFNSQETEVEIKIKCHNEIIITDINNYLNYVYLCKIKEEKITQNKNEYFCEKHSNENFNFFCKDCNKNICKECKNSHEISHNLINFDEIKLDEKKFEEFNENIKNYENFVNKIKNVLDKIINDLNDYIKKINKLYNNYKSKNEKIIEFLKIFSNLYKYSKNKNVYNFSIISNLFIKTNFPKIPNNNFILNKKFDIQIKNILNSIHIEKKIHKIKLKKITTLKNHNSSILCLNILNNNNIISGDKENQLKIFSPDYNLILQTKTKEFIWHILQLPNSNIICGENNGTMQIFDIKTLELKHTYSKIDNGLPIWNLAIYKNKIISCSKFSIKSWNFQEPFDLICEIFLDFNLFLESIFILPFDKLILISDDKLCRFFNMKNNVLESVIKGVGCCSRTGFELINKNILCVASRYDKILHIINLISFEIIDKIYFNNDIVCLKYLKDKNILLIGEMNGNDLSVLNLSKKNVCKNYFDFKNKKKDKKFLTGINAIVQDYKGNILTCSYDNLIEIYSINN